MNYKQTKTGDLVQMRECKEGDVTYGVIAIKPKDQYPDLTDAEKVLLAFMEQLQYSFAIQHTTGLHVETYLQRNKTSITNYWRDHEQTDWKVKGWTNGTTLAVLYIKNIGSVPVGKEESFLNGNYTM